MLQAVRLGDDPREVAVADESNPVEGRDSRDRHRRRKLRHGPSDSEHRREVGRDLDVQRHVDIGRSSIRDCDPLVQAFVDKAHALHVNTGALELESCGAVVGLQSDRRRFDPVDQDAQRGEDSCVARPQTVTGELAWFHRSIPRRNREEAIVLEHHTLGDEVPGRNQVVRSRPP